MEMKNLKDAIISSGLIKIMGWKGCYHRKTKEKDLQFRKIPYGVWKMC